MRMQMRAGWKEHKNNECCHLGSSVLDTNRLEEKLGQTSQLILLLWDATTLPGTNYFGIFYNPSQMDKFELRLIPEFNVSPIHCRGSRRPKQVRTLFKVKEPSMVIPWGSRKEPMQYTCNLRMMQTWKKSSVPCIQLLGQTPSSHGKFVGRLLGPGETDVFLADLRRLAVPFGGASDCILECAFMAGLPDDVSLLLWVPSRLDELEIDKLLAKAWNILKDTELVAVAKRTAETPTERQHAAGDSTMPRLRESPKCYRCGGLNRYSRDCQSRGNTRGANDQKTRAGPHSAKLFGETGPGTGCRH